MIELTALFQALCTVVAGVLGLYLTVSMLVGIVYIVLDPQEEDIDLVEINGVKYCKDKHGRINPYEY